MDIYSFAIVSWEMYQRKRPFQGYKAYQLMEEVCRNLLRPMMPMDKAVCPRGLQKLIRKCWHQDPQERPSAKEVINVIEFGLCAIVGFLGIAGKVCEDETKDCSLQELGNATELASQINLRNGVTGLTHGV